MGSGSHAVTCSKLVSFAFSPAAVFSGGGQSAGGRGRDGAAQHTQHALGRVEFGGRHADLEHTPRVVRVRRAA
eukprot:278554-Prymnesium_polylepis.1